jgi:tyrosine-protein phosphatase SIW14
MSRSLQLAFSLVVVFVLVGGPLWYKRQHERHFRNFRVVHDGVLYRSGQLDLDGLKRIVHDYGIKTIVSLREGDAAEDQQEAEWAARVSINHVRIPPRLWSEGTDGVVPAEQGLAAFRQVLDNPANHRVLVHCFAGIHRTGAFCAVYRMQYQGWSNREAIAELRALGYATLDDDEDVHTFLDRYRPAQNRSQLRLRKHDWMITTPFGKLDDGFPAIFRPTRASLPGGENTPAP